MSRRRRDQDRTIDSDPATQPGLSVPKTFEPTTDPTALHEEQDVDRMLDREARSEDDADVHRHERPPIDSPTDPQAVEELAGEAILLATQGGGSRRIEGDDSLEEQIDRDAMEAGIVPQLVGQATLDSAAGTDEEQPDVDEDADTLPRARPGRTSVRGRRTSP
ncbi:hypothetical protein [Sandaracinus amylolyticus]|uniref:Uncharacterized protein n=1 Tax=Sandaracinus amylolyticus TaxID=927083 RepID=A0A0F6YNU6_9BACT|nr:hypothetical protein [Sandaracinus amylolyticus]AKF10753.1 hypothetical protein DB32_007902 [Sandaracinus amylolyticus]